MNFNGSNDTLIKLDRLSFVLPWCSTSLRLAFSFNLCQLYMHVHRIGWYYPWTYTFSRVKIVPSEEGILLRCLRRSYINCLSPHCSKNLHRKDTFRILRKVERILFVEQLEKISINVTI